MNADARTGPCRACGADMIWAKMSPSGKNNPLDVLQVAPFDPNDASKVRKGVVAYRPDTGTAKMVTQADVTSGAVDRWAASGVTCHLSHFATCPQRQQFRRKAPAAEPDAQQRECPVDGCTEIHGTDMLMCGRHWFTVPQSLRNILYAAIRQHGIASGEYLETREACIAAAEGRPA